MIFYVFSVNMNMYVDGRKLMLVFYCYFDMTGKGKEKTVPPRSKIVPPAQKQAPNKSPPAKKQRVKSLETEEVGICQDLDLNDGYKKEDYEDVACCSKKQPNKKKGMIILLALNDFMLG